MTPNKVDTRNFSKNPISLGLKAGKINKDAEICILMVAWCAVYTASKFYLSFKLVNKMNIHQKTGETIDKEECALNVARNSI